MNDLRLRVIGDTSSTEIGRWLPSSVQERMSQPSVAPEIEIVFLPGPGKFSGQAGCNLLVVTEPTPAASKLAKAAHVVVSDYELPAPQAFYDSASRISRRFEIGRLIVLSRSAGRCASIISLYRGKCRRFAIVAPQRLWYIRPFST